ncbi:MAG: hypothetical protein JWM32_3138 [Verrucomicrobia bacterium]|nr:hypothetical protein [Verrucomicrobiota bacterium]
MKVIVTGGVDYVMTLPDYEYLATMVHSLAPHEVMTDGSEGVAKAVDTWCSRRAIPVDLASPNWGAYRERAVLQNNLAMVSRADAVIAFPGGFHVAHLLVLAREKRLAVWESPSRRLHLLTLNPLPVRPTTVPRPAA